MYRSIRGDQPLVSAASLIVRAFVGAAVVIHSKPYQSCVKVGVPVLRFRAFV
jgi:hypothetical protein